VSDQPGEDLYDWESEWAALEDDIRTDPGEALKELDELVTRMLDEAGYDPRDPVVSAGDDREVIDEYLAAREITQAYERGSEELSPGDIAAAVNGYRELYEYLVSDRGPTDG
jgi:hypothetical protein